MVLRRKEFDEEILYKYIGTNIPILEEFCKKVVKTGGWLSGRLLEERAARKDLSFEPVKEDFAGDPKLRERIEKE